MPAHAEAVIEWMLYTVPSEIFYCCRDVVMSRCSWGLAMVGLAAALMIKFIILSVLARILTPPQYIVNFFCRLHRLSYYVAMLGYFFRILFFFSVVPL